MARLGWSGERDSQDGDYQGEGDTFHGFPFVVRKVIAVRVATMANHVPNAAAKAVKNENAVMV